MYSKETYSRIRNWFLEKDSRFKLLRFIYKFLPLAVLISYPLLLLYLMITGSYKLLQCVTVPLGVFVTVTLIRKFVDAQRPYEKLGTEPLIKKDTKGLSFPSRHTASAAVIAMTFLFVNVPLGIAFLIAAALIAVSRVLAGVHFPRDVLAAFIYAVFMSVIFFYVL